MLTTSATYVEIDQSHDLQLTIKNCKFHKDMHNRFIGGLHAWKVSTFMHKIGILVDSPYCIYIVEKVYGIWYAHIMWK